MILAKTYLRGLKDSEVSPRAAELRRLGRLLTAASPASLALEVRRLALRALGVSVFANGDDPARWSLKAHAAV